MKSIANTNKRQLDANLFVVYDKKYDSITYYVHGKFYSHNSASRYRDELASREKNGKWIDDGMLEWLNKVTS